MPREKFQNKYRIKSARLPNWDYGKNGIYYITICTKNMYHHFGKVKNEKMILNGIGELANKFWYSIPSHFPFVKLGEFVVMPNHTHGILTIDKKDVDTIDDDSVADATDIGSETLQCNVKADTNKVNQSMSDISPKPGSIPTIIRSYKSIVTKNARYINPDFAWHPRYYDHIIRDERSFHNISNYIAANPKDWKKDKFRKIQ